MKYERRREWTGRHGNRLPPGYPRPRGGDGLDTARVPAIFRSPSTPQRAVEEVGLTLTPPPRYRSLLVPVDGHQFGEHALPLALGIARRTGAEVQVVHVHRSWPVVDQLPLDRGLEASLRRRQQAYLDDLFRRLAKITSVPVTTVSLRGRDIAERLGEAASAGTDLVVMATHGRGPLGRLWAGSVADVLVRQLSVPLLLVRGYDAPADLTGDPRLRHVLVPLDGSAVAEQVLEPALALGALTRADHTLLRVLPLEADDLGRGRQEEARAYLRRLADRLGGRAQHVHPRLVLDDRPTARAILGYAQTRDADLIALATQGRGGLSRLFRSSVVDQVIRGASVPVLVFRPDAP